VLAVTPLPHVREPDSGDPDSCIYCREDWPMTSTGECPARLRAALDAALSAPFDGGDHVDAGRAWAAFEALPLVAGPWTREEGGWYRGSTEGGRAAVVIGNVVTRAMLYSADARIIRRGYTLVSGVPGEDVPGIAPECGEIHPMWRAEMLGTPRREPPELTRCERPRGHLGACGGRMSDGFRGSAGNARERG
jgi:hypothetical protein